MQSNEEEDNSGQKSTIETQFTPMRKKGKKKPTIDEKVAKVVPAAPSLPKKDISIEQLQSNHDYIR